MLKNNIDLKKTENFMNKVAFLDGIQRKELLPPEEILGRLPINKSDRVLDVGAGSGFLTIPVAKMVNETVFALDIDQRMLKIIQEKADDRNINNIELLKGNLDNIPLPVGSIDIVLASLILHEVRPLPKVINQIGGVLKVGGYLLCLEYEKDNKIVQGPPMNIRIKSSELEEELIKAGFCIVRKEFPQESIYIIIAKKKEDLYNANS
ncbi:MAG: SAM-dependent methyltransferase [Firmicutes bacterium HGW-Firmicutes-7]|nr:MAG: SAM-dependent methyltransferase [Firmicutes bacterium HGW-Firmicutes-7]